MDTQYAPTFGGALAALEAGLKVTRDGWNGKGQFLILQTPDENSKMTLPYIFITTVDGNKVPWIASQTDILSADWQVVVDDTAATLPPGAVASSEASDSTAGEKAADGKDEENA